MEEKNKIIEQIAKEFLAHLDEKAEISLEEDRENQAIKVKIKTDNPGALIGFHGKTLSAFQLLLGLMVYRRLGEWQRIIVDVNNYRAEQTERLKKIALNAAQRVKFSGQPVILSPMTPFERRIIHLTLNDFAGVETVSQGEGDQRHIVVRPAKTGQLDEKNR